MKRTFSTALPALLWLSAFAAQAQPVVANPSFETPNIGPCPNFQIAPSGTGWVFTSAGISTGGCAKALNVPVLPTGGGTQVAFIQSGVAPGGNTPENVTASISQAVSGFIAGHGYTITFHAAGRPQGAGCTDNCTELNFSVFAGSTDVLDVKSPPTDKFQQYTTNSFTAAGTITIAFSGFNPSGDAGSSFIDLVSIQDLGIPSIPSIGGVVSASAFGEFASASPGSWVEIYGSNLASETRNWTTDDFTGINAPTSLSGTSVTIGGQDAFVDYISPGQVNALSPSDVPTGVQQIILTAGGVASAPVNITINAVQPGLLAPPSFKVNDVQYVVALFGDGTYVLPTGAISGLNSRPAKPGDEIVLYGVGFGPVTPDISAGQLVQQSNTLADTFQISIGGIAVQPAYDGLAPNYTGLYQINITVPEVAASNQPLTFTVDGLAGTQILYVAIAN